MWRLCVAMVAAGWLASVAGGVVSRGESPANPSNATLVPTPGTAVLGIAGVWFLRRGRKRSS